MIHMTTNEVVDLKQCQHALERVLVSLDTAGAGIAAIHVNAAIEQLKRNMAVIAADTDILKQTQISFPEQNE